MHWTPTPASSRQPVLARNVIATSQPLAAQAGARSIARGGNAIGRSAGCGHHPHGGGAGHERHRRRRVCAGVGRRAFARAQRIGPRPGAAWNPGRFKGLDAIPARGWDSVTVPGEVSGWVALSKRFGALPFADLFTDAIRHARDGFPVSPVIAQQWASRCVTCTCTPALKHLCRAAAAHRRGRDAAFCRPGHYTG